MDIIGNTDREFEKLNNGQLALIKLLKKINTKLKWRLKLVYYSHNGEIKMIS